LRHDDIINNFETIEQVYAKSLPNYTGNYTLPILWDKKLGKIVNNDSYEISKMLN
jgi:putative glutathione S-transferase